MKKWFTLLLVIITFSCKKVEQKPIFSSLVVDKDNKSIIFSVTLNPDYTTRDQYFLFYFHGYPWLKNISLFHSRTPLIELQTAIAYISWELWDRIYTRVLSVDISEIKIYFELFPDKWVEIEKILDIKNYTVRHICFWGSPIYDSVVLSQKYYDASRCASCVFLPIEQSLFLSNLSPLKIGLRQNLSTKSYRVKFVFSS